MLVLTQLRSVVDVLVVMRRIGVAAILVLVLIAATSASASGARHKLAPVCHLPAHSRIIVADAQAMVFKKERSGESEGGIYGCSFGSRHTYLLVEGQSDHTPFGTQTGYFGITSQTLAGTIVAWEEGVEAPETHSSFTIYVRNLGSGHLRQIPKANHTPMKSLASALRRTSWSRAMDRWHG